MLVGVLKIVFDCWWVSGFSVTMNLDKSIFFEVLSILEKTLELFCLRVCLHVHVCARLQDLCTITFARFVCARLQDLFVHVRKICLFTIARSVCSRSVHGLLKTFTAYRFKAHLAKKKAQIHKYQLCPRPPTAIKKKMNCVSFNAALIIF